MRRMGNPEALLGLCVEVVVSSSSPDITQLLNEIAEGDQEALQELIPLVYKELHGLAARCMGRERQDHTLQPTALVNEAYLKLVGQRKPNWENRARFFAAAAQLMRRILIDHAKHHLRAKRGGADQKVSLDEVFLSRKTNPPSCLPSISR